MIYALEWLLTCITGFESCEKVTHLFPNVPVDSSFTCSTYLIHSHADLPFSRNGEFLTVKRYRILYYNTGSLKIDSERLGHSFLEIFYCWKAYWENSFIVRLAFARNVGNHNIIIFVSRDFGVYFVETEHILNLQVIFIETWVLKRLLHVQKLHGVKMAPINSKGSTAFTVYFLNFVYCIHLIPR